jgi:hypothetical protein
MVNSDPNPPQQCTWQAPPGAVAWHAVAINGRIITVNPPSSPAAASLMGVDLLNPPPIFSPNLRVIMELSLQIQDRLLVGECSGLHGSFTCFTYFTAHFTGNNLDEVES